MLPTMIRKRGPSALVFARGPYREHSQSVEKEWLGEEESNLRSQIQNLTSYR